MIKEKELILLKNKDILYFIHFLKRALLKRDFFFMFKLLILKILSKKKKKEEKTPQSILWLLVQILKYKLYKS